MKGYPHRAWAMIVMILLIVISTVQASEPGPRDIINSHLKAIGGEQALVAIHNTLVNADITMAAQGLNLKASIYKARPNMQRQEFQVNGQTIIMATDGDKTWTINPLAGISKAIEMPTTQSVGFTRSSWFDDLFLGNIEKRGLKLAYEATVEEDGVNYHHLIVTFKDGVKQHRYYHATTGMLAKTKNPQVTPMGEQEVVTTFSDWREIAGVKFPHHIANDQGLDIKVTKVAANVDVDKTMFSLPE